MKNLIDTGRPESFNPWRELTSLQRQMESLLDEFSRYQVTKSRAVDVDFVPACDVEESESSYLFTIDIPGMTRDQLRVEVSGNTLTVSGEKEEKKEGKGARRSFERYHGRFERSFTLPEISETNAIQADYKDGVLRIAIPKSEGTKERTRKIPIGEGKSALFATKPTQTRPEEKKEQKTPDKAA